MARRASCRVATAFSTTLKTNLAEIQPQNHQNVQKTYFWRNVPGVNGLKLVGCKRDRQKSKLDYFFLFFFGARRRNTCISIYVSMFLKTLLLSPV